MAFLGGLQGLGALAGGVEQGVNTGFGWDQYLQNVQAQNLAGNILGAYGGQTPQQPLAGLSQPLASGPSGSGDTTGAVSPADPSLTPPQLGGTSAMNTALGTSPSLSSVSNLFTPGANQLVPPGQPAVGAGLGAGQGSPQAASPSQGTSLLPQSQYQPPQPSGGQGIGGMGQQLTLPQFVQLARQVNPNASGRQIMLAASELGKGGLLGFGGMTPYQAAELQLQLGASARDWEKLRIETERGQSTEQHQRAQEGHQARTEAGTEAWRRMETARWSLDSAERQLADAQSHMDRINQVLDPDSLSPEDQKLKAELPTQIRALTAARDRAQKAFDRAQKDYADSGAAADAGGGGASDEEQSIENAKEAIKNNPAMKDQILKKLHSVYPDASVD